uniref:Uncharacterized protein n=1 Tax=Anguilla anguilla TaxID=7936 RepID=A0A0E9R634_ANGAN
MVYVLPLEGAEKDTPQEGFPGETGERVNKKSEKGS